MNPTHQLWAILMCISLPYIDVGIRKAEIETLVKKNIDAAREDWDSFENSHGISTTHPLVRFTPQTVAKIANSTYNYVAVLHAA